RRKVARPAWGRAAEDEPERHAAGPLRAPVLAVADPRIVRSPGAAGQGPGWQQAAGDGRGLVLERLWAFSRLQACLKHARLNRPAIELSRSIPSSVWLAAERVPLSPCRRYAHPDGCVPP